MADGGGQQVLSPYHAMGCNPVSMVDPLELQYFVPATPVINQAPSAFARMVAPTLGMHLPGGSVWGLSNMSRYISRLPKELQAEAWMMYLSGGATGEGSFQRRLVDYLQARAAKGQEQKVSWAAEKFIHFVYNLDNGYDIFDEKGNIIMTFLNDQVVHGFNYKGATLEKWQKWSEKKEKEKTSEGYELAGKMLTTFDVISSFAEAAGVGSTFTRSLGNIATFLGPAMSYQVNSIDYESGKIDKDRYELRNIGIVSSAGLGYAAGTVHPMAGLAVGEGVNQLFTGIEKSADYLTSGFNQMKSQVIFQIKNSIR